MFINLTNIDFCPGSGGGSANLQEDKSVTYTTNGNYTIQPDDGYDGLSSVGVTVNYDGTDYRNQNGTVDFDGLRAIGWDETSINYLNANALHYPWENDKYLVSDGNKALYGVVNKDNVSSYKSDPNFIYCPYFDTAGMTSTFQMFKDCSSLKTIPLLDTSSVTEMSYMFRYCTNLQTIPKLDTSNVTNMGNMFEGCSKLQNIPQLNTSKVTNMSGMFSDCNSLQNIPLLDTSNVRRIGYMFYKCKLLQTIPKLNTSNVTDMYETFSDCNSLQNIPLLDTSSVTDMSGMFSDCNSLQNIPLLDTSSVTKMAHMFDNCKILQSIPQLDTSKVTDMSYIFNGCESLQNISQLDTSKVTDMSSMFFNCKSLQTIPELNTSNVTNMGNMFQGWFVTMILERIEGLDMSNVNITTNTFYGCSKLSYIRLNGSLNVGLDISATSKLDYESVKSVLTAASNTVNTNSKTLRFNSTLTDQNGELAALVSTCTSKGWTINGLTLN